MTYILFGARSSLYSGKARAYMDWKNVDYSEVSPSPEVHEKIIVPAVGRPVIPVVKTGDGQIIQDTTKIIDYFEAKLGGPGVYPDTPKQKYVTLLLETFGDEWLLVPAMHYRWHYNEEWIFGEFGRVVAPDASAEKQAELGRMVGAGFRGFVPMLGINERTIPAIEKSYEALLADLDAHFAHHPYLLGTRPSIGDFGLIGPLYAHLYRDPASGEIMERLAPRVAQWVRRMVEVEQPLSGEFLADDEVPATLMPVLQRMMEEHIPVLARTAELFGQWCKDNAGAEIPRGIGMVPFTIEGTTGEQIARPFSLWMIQRALDYRDALSPDDRAGIEQWLAPIGGAALAQLTLPYRLDFSTPQLKLANEFMA